MRQLGVVAALVLVAAGYSAGSGIITVLSFTRAGDLTIAMPVEDR